MVQRLHQTIYTYQTHPLVQHYSWQEGPFLDQLVPWQYASSSLYATYTDDMAFNFTRVKIDEFPPLFSITINYAA